MLFIVSRESTLGMLGVSFPFQSLDGDVPGWYPSHEKVPDKCDS